MSLLFQVGSKTLRLASGKGHVEVVKVLLSAGADIEAEDDVGQYLCISAPCSLISAFSVHLLRELFPYVLSIFRLVIDPSVVPVHLVIWRLLKCC